MTPFVLTLNKSHKPVPVTTQAKPSQLVKNSTMKSPIKVSEKKHSHRQDTECLMLKEIYQRLKKSKAGKNHQTLSADF